MEDNNILGIGSNNFPLPGPNYVKRVSYNKELRKSVLAFLGGKCNRCGITDIRVLQVDHVNGGGNQERKQLRGSWHLYENILQTLDNKNYQLLCANCNWIKRYDKREVRHG